MAKNFMELGAAKAPENRVLIVDTLNLGFRWKHQNRTDFAEDYISTVQSFATSYNCGTIIAAMDRGHSAYRRSLYPEYKADRAEKYKDQTEAEKLAFEKFMDEMYRMINIMQSKTEIFTLEYDNVEADDIAAYIVKNREEFEMEHIWLISTDRDWDLLISPNVSRFSYINRKETTFENWKDTHNYTIEDYITIKCLMGDSGDNVTGIPQIGPKRAEGLVKEFGSAFDIYDAAPFSSRYKYIQSLNENIERLLRNYELMDLLTYCEEAINFPANKNLITATINTDSIYEWLRPGHIRG